MAAERADEQQRQEREAQQRAQQQREAAERLAKIQAEKAAKQQAEQRQREEAERLAKIQAEKAAKQQAEGDYMETMRRGIRLAATKCPDGAGHYYVTGKMPKAKGDYCINVHYQAICPGSRVIVNGVAHNFIGMSGCFGDTYQIDPKPACAVDQVRVEVTDVRPCR